MRKAGEVFSQSFTAIKVPTHWTLTVLVLPRRQHFSWRQTDVWLIEVVDGGVIGWDYISGF